MATVTEAKTAHTSKATHDRLLEAAIQVFGEVGYRDATLREICRRAGANNAAINYHFGGKEHLYLAVIEHAIQDMKEHMPAVDSSQAAPPEEKLRGMIGAFLRDLLGHGPPTWLTKLFAREMAEPTKGLDLIVEKACVPFFGRLEAIVRELIGPATAQQVRDCALSVIGQCVHFNHGRALLSRLGPYRVYDPPTIEHLADHIARFSLAGIREVGRQDI